jgi:hypothetical protein
MKTSRVSLVKNPSLCFLLILSFAPAASPQGRPASVGQLELRKYEATHGVEAPEPRRRQVDSNQLQREADELSRLAQSIPTDVKSVTKGTLPKDVLDKLKRIEKLSKHLRGELVP